MLLYILFCNSNVKYDEKECQLLSNKLLVRVKFQLDLEINVTVKCWA